MDPRNDRFVASCIDWYVFLLRRWAFWLVRPVLTCLFSSRLSPETCKQMDQVWDLALGPREKRTSAPPTSTANGLTGGTNFERLDGSNPVAPGARCYMLGPSYQHMPKIVSPTLGAKLRDGGWRKTGSKFVHPSLLCVFHVSSEASSVRYLFCFHGLGMCACGDGRSVICSGLREISH